MSFLRWTVHSTYASVRLCECQERHQIWWTVANSVEHNGVIEWSDYYRVFHKFPIRGSVGFSPYTVAFRLCFVMYQFIELGHRQHEGKKSLVMAFVNGRYGSQTPRMCEGEWPTHHALGWVRNRSIQRQIWEQTWKSPTSVCHLSIRKLVSNPSHNKKGEVTKHHAHVRRVHGPAPPPSSPPS